MNRKFTDLPSEEINEGYSLSSVWGKVTSSYISGYLTLFVFLIFFLSLLQMFPWLDLA